METPDWAASEAYLRGRAEELLTAEGEAAMSVLLLANRQVEAVHVHAWLLRRCRDEGIVAGYAALHRELAGEGDPNEASPAEILVEWVETPDWDASQAFMDGHATSLLTDESEAALADLVAAEPANRTLATHLTLLRRCRKLGIPAAYAELRLLVDDPLDDALAALLRIDSAASLAQTLADHPVLVELRAVERMAAIAREAQAAGPAPVAAQALYFAIVLADGYQRAGARAAEPHEQAVFAQLLERMIDLAEALADPYLAGELRQMLARSRDHGAAAPAS